MTLPTIDNSVSLEQIAKTICEFKYGATLTGFAEGVRRILIEIYGEDDGRLIAKEMDVGFIPDAWRIDGPKVIIYEIEDHSPLRMDKLRKLISFWRFCDDNELDFECYTLDRYGRNPNPVDLKLFYYALMEIESAI